MDAVVMVTVTRMSELVSGRTMLDVTEQVYEVISL